MGRPLKLAAEEQQRRIAELPDWRLVNERLSRKFHFSDFRSALEFVNRVGEAAEAMNHHPDIHLGWGRADIETWTHDAGGVTELDFALAAKIDEQYAGRVK